MSSRDKARYVLIAALSGRALAVSAREAGYAPLVADLFGDEDMRATAHLSTLTTGDLGSGLDVQGLIRSLRRLAAGRTCEGLVCGSGFEDRPRVLARLASLWPLLGNEPDAVSRAKEPFGLAELCAELGVPHPPVRATCPTNPRGWLRKSIGGSGGGHVRAAETRAEPPASVYYQRHVAGNAVSILFLANGEDVLPLGFSAQWSHPTLDRPARYGGAVRPAGIGTGLKHKLGEIAHNLTRKLGLRGLNSVDFLIDGEKFWLIEINPRPGATLDVFRSRATSLFALHVEACRGVLPSRAPVFRAAAAAATVYATHRIAEMPRLDWPDWCADRQSAGSRVEAGAPICTVLAQASSSARARALAEARISTLLSLTQRERI